MIPNFKQFINEGVESVISLSELKKYIEPFGWVGRHASSGDGYKFSKGRHVVNFHLKHSNSKDDNRKMDVGSLDVLRGYIIDDFREDGDLTLIKSIPWKKWRLTDPFDRELIDIDPETGEKKVVIKSESEKSIGQKLSDARLDKSIKNANELYKDIALWKIDINSDSSAYIMQDTNKMGKSIYNVCRSIDDRRPLYKEWVYDYEERNGKYYFGKDDMRSLNTKFRRLLSDGSLEKSISYIKESKNY